MGKRDGAVNVARPRSNANKLSPLLSKQKLGSKQRALLVQTEGAEYSVQTRMDILFVGPSVCVFVCEFVGVRAHMRARVFSSPCLCAYVRGCFSRRVLSSPCTDPKDTGHG